MWSDGWARFVNPPEAGVSEYPGQKPQVSLLRFPCRKTFQGGASTQRSLHCAPPDFLCRPVALMICMRLSLRRAAHVVVASSAK
jgi:hypothetical protein